MPKLFVGNVTQQLNIFSFWMPETTRPVYLEIPIGGQVQVPGVGREIPKEIVDSILSQHEMYGIRSVADAFKSREFSGIVYSLDRPIKYDDLLRLVDKYRGLLFDRGRTMREQAAVATDTAIQEAMYRDQVPGRLSNLEMSVEEVNRDQRDETPEVSEGVRVTRDANPDGTRIERPVMRRRRGRTTAS